MLLLGSALILRGLRIHERRDPRHDARSAAGAGHHFWRDLRQGLRFVLGNRLLVMLAVMLAVLMAVLMAVWQMCAYAAMTVQILFATRTLGLSEQAVGRCYMGMGVGSIVGGLLGRRVSHRIGPGPCLVVGYAITSAGWLLLAAAPANGWGIAVFALVMMGFTTGAVFIFINFLALRQAVTPASLLGRMTATMRWLTLLAAAPGALVGGWLGEHVDLRAALLFSGAVSALLVLLSWRLPLIRSLRALPEAERESEWLGVEADVRPVA